MNMIYRWLCVGVMSAAMGAGTIRPSAKKDLTLHDTIEVVIATQEVQDIITSSDVVRPGLQGATRTVDDLIFEALVCADARKHKIEPDDDAVDRYLAKVMQENGLSLHELEDIFRQGGRTLREGREELRKMQAFNGMLDFKIRSNVLVSKKEVEAYYHDKPEYEPAQYELEYAVIAYDSSEDKAVQKKKLEESLVSTKKSVTFGNPFWVNAEDIAQDRQALSSLVIGASMVFESPEGFEVYRMRDRKERRLRTLQERYRDITSVLMQPKYEQMMQEYRQQLIEGASVLYLR